MSVINFFYKLFSDAKGETRIMYVSDFGNDECENIEMNIVLASCQRPPSFSLFLFLLFSLCHNSFRTSVDNVKVNLRNGVFKIRDSSSHLPLRESSSLLW